MSAPTQRTTPTTMMTTMPTIMLTMPTPTEKSNIDADPVNDANDCDNADTNGKDRCRRRRKTVMSTPTQRTKPTTMMTMMATPTEKTDADADGKE